MASGEPAAHALLLYRWINFFNELLAILGVKLQFYSVAIVGLLFLLFILAVREIHEIQMLVECLNWWMNQLKFDLICSLEYLLTAGDFHLKNCWRPVELGRVGWMELDRPFIEISDWFSFAFGPVCWFCVVAFYFGWLNDKFSLSFPALRNSFVFEKWGRKRGKEAKRKGQQAKPSAAKFEIHFNINICVTFNSTRRRQWIIRCGVDADRRLPSEHQSMPKAAGGVDWIKIDIDDCHLEKDQYIDFEGPVSIDRKRCVVAIDKKWVKCENSTTMQPMETWERLNFDVGLLNCEVKSKESN